MARGSTDLFWAYEQAYGHKELHAFETLDERNAWVSKASGLCPGLLGYRDYPREGDFDGDQLIHIHRSSRGGVVEILRF